MIPAAVCLVMCFASLATAATTLNFLDDTFDTADWSIVSAGMGVTIHSQSLLGGNPDAYLVITNHPTPTPGSSISGFHLHSGFVYDPGTDGELTSIEYSFDYQGIQSGQATGLAIVQDGNNYARGTFVTSSLTWISTGTTTLLPGDLPPAMDLSPTGAPITFGLFSANTFDPVAGDIDYIVGYDNLSITVNTTGIAPLTGDLNGDGFVGVDDLNIVLVNWNQNVTPGDLSAGDPTGEGFVGVDDLNIVLVNWNNGTPPADGGAIPEPGTMGVLGLLGLGLLRRRGTAC